MVGVKICKFMCVLINQENWHLVILVNYIAYPCSILTLIQMSENRYGVNFHEKANHTTHNAFEQGFDCCSSS